MIHSRTFREAKTLDKAMKTGEDGLERGRIYCNDSFTTTPDGKFRFVIKLPEELQRQIDAGEAEVEFILPEGGAYVYLGQDAKEKMAQLKKKDRLKLARTGQVLRKV